MVGGGNIEQEYRDAAVGDVGGDAGAHGAGAEDGCAADEHGDWAAGGMGSPGVGLVVDRPEAYGGAGWWVQDRWDKIAGSRW